MCSSRYLPERQKFAPIRPSGTFPRETGEGFDFLLCRETGSLF